MYIVITFILFIILGIPIAWVLGLEGLLMIFKTGNTLFLNMAPQRMFNGINKFSLLAIPFFMLAGEIMSTGGIAKRLINLARIMVGHLRGGLAHVNIVASMILAALMGSANAEASVMGTIMVPAMEEDGYDKDFSGAITAAAAIQGPIIPPSMTAIIYGVTAGVSVGSLFLAGVIPGILMGLSLMAVAYYISLKRNYPKKDKRESFIKMGKEFIKAIPALIIPTIMMGGIVSGVFTPTEAGIVAAFVALIVGLFVYKEMKISELPDVLLNTAIKSSAILLIVSAASIFGWMLAFEQIPQTISSMFLNMSSSPIVFLLIINVFLILVGCTIETFAAIVILVPVLLPVVTKFGIDPVHFGMIMILNLIIGLLTPPVGVCLFVTSSVTGIEFERLAKEVLPFLGVLLIVLLLVTFFPFLSTWLPGILLG